MLVQGCNRWGWLGVAVLVMLACAPHLGWTQSPEAALHGKAPANAQITAQNTATGLTRHTRSLLTIAMLVALNRPEELRLHLRAAKNNGVTPDEIKEVLLHAAVYCGLPAANAAFRLAAEELSPERSDHP